MTFSTQAIRASGGSGNITPTNITYSDLSTDILDRTAKEGFYLITDSLAADAGVLVQVFKDSGGVLNVRLEAEGVYLNPDYQDNGVYSGIPGASTRRGLWYAGLAGLAAGQIVIWSGLHYANLTGNVGTAPDGDAVNWLAYDKSTSPLTRGYITESDFILYDFTADALLKRTDKRGNSIERDFSLFQWGNDVVENCTADYLSTISNINSRGIATDGVKALDGAIVFQDETNEGHLLVSDLSGQYALSAQGQFTLNIASGAQFRGLDVKTNNAITFKGSSSIYSKTLHQDLYSTFDNLFDISGLTTFNFLVGGVTYDYVGIANLSSTNATESIDTFANFQTGVPVRFYPETGLVVTFVHNTAANKPRCAGASNAIVDGTTGDWIEFTKAVDGFIYQTGISNYGV